MGTPRLPSSSATFLLILYLASVSAHWEAIKDFFHPDVAAKLLLDAFEGHHRKSDMYNVSTYDGSIQSTRSK